MEILSGGEFLCLLLNFKENHTDGKLIKKEESVESAPKSRNKIEWESLSQVTRM